MTLGVRGKLFLVSLTLIGSVGLVSGIYLERTLRSWLEQQIEAGMEGDARSAAALIVALPLESFDAAADLVARELSATSDQRFLVVRESEGAPPLAVDVSRRYSVELRTYIVAVVAPFDAHGVRGVVRVEKPLSQVDAAIWRLRLALAATAAGALVMAIIMSGLASHLASRALRGLVENARAITSGESRERLPVSSSDELGRLAGSFNRIVDSLNTTLRDLVAERDHLGTILESMVEGIMVLDENRRVTHLNSAAQRVLELSGASYGRALVETKRVPELLDLVAGLSPEAPVKSSEFVLGSGRRVLARASRFASTEGCVVVLHDVTEVRRLESVRRDFVANVSHELRTPVAVIRANSETLLAPDLLPDPAASALMDAIHRNAERLGQLISDLLDLARLEAGEQPFTSERVMPGNVAARVIESLQTRARARALSVEQLVPMDLGVRADEKALEQVLFNLLDNAIKYCTPSGHIQVVAERRGSLARIAVVDDGPGIDPPHRDRIFERFYRVDAGRSREMGGTGLGLSIVKHLVLSMGGSVGHEPATPRGSCFWFTLPIGE